MNRRRDLLFWLLCAAVGTDALGIGILFPLLARIQTLHHLPTYGLGLMAGASFFAGLVAGLLIVRFLDGGASRLVLLGGLALGAVALLWFAWSGTLPQLVGARALGGVAYGIVAPAALRQASVGAGGADRGRRLGILSSSMMVGIVIGPLAGAVLASGGDLALPFEVVAALLAVVLLAVAVVTAEADDSAHPEVDPHDAAGLADEHPTTRRSLPALRLVVAVLALAAAAQLCNGLYDALWSRLLTDRGASELLIGLSLSLFGLPFIVLAPFGGKLAERRGPLLATALALLCADVLVATYGLVPSPVVITILGVVEACFQAVAVPGGYAAVARTFPESMAATGQGWANSAGTAAAGVAAVVGAPVYAAFGPGAVFVGGAVTSVAFVAVAVALGRHGQAARPGPADLEVVPADAAAFVPGPLPAVAETGHQRGGLD